MKSWNHSYFTLSTIICLLLPPLSLAFVLSCAFPKEPAGGDVSVTHLHAGGEAYFRCLTGYRLQGTKMLTCRNATTPYWSGKEPRCVGEKFGLSDKQVLFHLASQSSLLLKYNKMLSSRSY